MPKPGLNWDWRTNAVHILRFRLRKNILLAETCKIIFIQKTMCTINLELPLVPHNHTVKLSQFPRENYWITGLRSTNGTKEES